MDIADAQLIWPGSFVDYPDVDAAHEAQVLLHTLDGAFAEALLALLLFGEARTRAVDEGGSAHERWERDMVERREAEDVAWQGRPDPVWIGDWDTMNRAMAEKRIEGERELTRRRWARGELPRSVAHHLPFMYARAFLFALDSIEKVLNVLAASLLSASMFGDVGVR